MTAADLWCLGIPPQPPHVPDGALIDVRAPRSFRLCADCFRRYNAGEGSR